MQDESKQKLWATRLLDHAKSGINIRSWCALEGLSEATFHYWRKRLAEMTASPTQLIALPLPGRSGATRLELETPQGYVIRISSQEQVGWLGDVLAALR